MLMNTDRKKHIVILGGGFAGLYTALELEKLLAHDPEVGITLVNRENFILFTPMLHEVAASDLDMTHIVNPIRKLLKRVRFFEGDVESIDLPGRTVVVSHGDDHHHHELTYDHLVIGLGSITNFFNIPGLEQRALTMKSLGDAITLRNRLIDLLEQADFECTIGREHFLSVVVAGGGFAGVETIAAVNDFLREAVEFYPHLSEELIRVVLVHPGKFILPELGEKLGAYAQRKLSERGVEIRVNTRVAGISDDGIILSDGSEIKANTLVWTAGTSPNPLLHGLPCQKEKGRILVDENMEVPGWPGVWALGDCAAIPDKQNSGKFYPPTAQHALRQGKVLANNITAAIHGERKRPFVFKTIGQLAAIGRRTGVANILGFNFSGFIAWWLWRSIYLSKLPRLEKKIRVAIDWTLDLIFCKDLVQFQTFRAPSISHGEDDYQQTIVKKVVELV
jgi:NADH dehydrogenase